MKRSVLILQFVALAFALAVGAEDPAPVSDPAAARPAAVRNPYPYAFFDPAQPAIASQPAANDFLSPMWTSYPISYPAWVWTPTSIWMPNQYVGPWPYFPCANASWYGYPYGLWCAYQGSWPPPSNRNIIYIGNGGIFVSWR